MVCNNEKDGTYKYEISGDTIVPGDGKVYSLHMNLTGTTRDNTVKRYNDAFSISMK